MEIRVARRYRLGKKIGEGSFGEVYSGTNVHTGENVALKLEPRRTRTPQLLFEMQLLKKLIDKEGFPGIKWFGDEGDYKVLVMDLLGPSLEKLFQICGNKFSLKTVLLLADQMIDRLEFLHSIDYLHGDIKPENFLMGLDSRKHICHIIDFGLSKRYFDVRTGRHIPYIEGKSMCGTARYVSMNTHRGIQQSRRDDMEALGYVLMYFLRGSLPWQGVKGSTARQKYHYILTEKVRTVPQILCEGYPTQFKEYFEHCLDVAFIDSPDYSYLKRIFKEFYQSQGFPEDGLFDWDLLPNLEELLIETSSKSEEKQSDDGNKDSNEGKNSTTKIAGSDGATDTKAMVSKEEKVGKESDEISVNVSPKKRKHEEEC